MIKFPNKNKYLRRFIMKNILNPDQDFVHTTKFKLLTAFVGVGLLVILAKLVS